MFHWRSTVAPPTSEAPVIELAFTNRAPALGEGPYAGFNLGGQVGDDPARVEGNRATLARALGVSSDRLLFMRQVHGTTVLEVSSPWAGEIPECDGIVTRTRGLALGVIVADCVPVLLHDSVAGVVGAVHAGRVGMTDRVVEVAVRRMRALGARDLAAVVGPSVCGRCYEVPEDLVAAAARTSPVSAARSWHGTPSVDVAAGIVDQLASEGVSVEWIPGCTREDDSLYSYRRDGQTGRFVGVVVMHEGDQGR